MKINRALKSPTAFLPLAFSGAALTVVLLRLAMVGTAPEMSEGRPDEGLMAHLWQILMVAQLPIIGAFVLCNLRNSSPQMLPMLGLQVIALLAAALPVFLLGW